MHADRFELKSLPPVPAATSALRFGACGTLNATREPTDHPCLEFSGDPSPSGEPEGLVARYAIRLARTPEHLNAAMRLMRERYQWRGYATDGPQDDSPGVTLVASELGRVAATVTVGADSPRGMAVESLYGEEVARLRREGASLCEFTRLAVDRAGNSLRLLGGLFHVAYLYARRQHDATHLLVEVNPRHVRFYTRMLGFRIAGPQRTCERVDAPAVMLALSLDHAENQIARYGGRPELAPMNRSLYPFFFSAGAEDGIIARLAGTDRTPRMTGLAAAICA